MEYNKSRIHQESRQYVKSAEYDEGLRKFMLSVYNYMAAALALTGVVAFGVANSPAAVQMLFGTPLYWVVALAPIGIVFYLSARVHKMSTGAAQAWFWVFAGLMGLSLASIFLVYTSASIARVFFITAAAFGGLSLYGYTTKKDLSGFGTFLFMGVIGLLIASVVNIFLASSGLQFAISAAGVLIFAGLTAYDTQNIKQSYYIYGGNFGVADKIGIMGALKLYLDFINLFIFLLQLIGDRR